MKRILNYTPFLIVLFCALPIKAQQKKDSLAVYEYIRKYKDIAIQEMKRAGIPASITMAQGIHESSFGTSYLSTNTNNHFGIKCKENWTGKTFKYTDDAPNECFRVYDKVEDSYKDHSDFLRNRPYYQPLFKLDIYDYKAWAYGLKKSGYATNPKYAEILIKIIEDYNLFLLDKGLPLPYLNNTSSTAAYQNNTIEENENTEDSIEVNANTPAVIEKKNEVIHPTFSTPVTTKKITKTILKVNKCKAVKIYPKNGETLDLLSNVLNIDKEDLLEYNDLTTDAQLKDGQLIFIQRKKKSNKEGIYKVQAADNLWSISQKMGIRLAALRRINKLENGEEPATNTVLSLKKKVAEQPAVRKPTDNRKSQAATAKSFTKEVNVVRARDTIYPDTNIPSNLSVDSNTVLGWESDTKLLEKPAIIPSATKKDTLRINTPTPKTTVPETTVPAPQPTQNSTGNPIEKTIYPTTIDYNKLPKSTTEFHTVIKGDTMYNICKRYGISITQLMQWNNMSEQSVKLGQVLKIRP
ncbi:MAG TPA: glucosaminidase domain-containing protein [Chitinophagales bacterium]|nr:glucosaminidase domain-containing protein [Chitinophagales bacterium]HNM32871.1 glucosaminidase domain-containing protein [Chitinophagales bacterium]